MHSYAALALAGLAIASHAIAQEVNAGAPLKRDDRALRLVIQALKPVYKLGEPIDLRVTIENTGKDTIFVGQIIQRMDWQFSIQMGLFDEQGNRSTELHWFHPFMQDYDPSEPFVNALVRSWLALPPGYSYGTIIQLHGSDFQFLKRPGRYRLEATYESYGMEEPLNYNRLAASPEDIKKLPYRSWRGKTSADPIVIIIEQKN